jgi:hypothetical protein
MVVSLLYVAGYRSRCSLLEPDASLYISGYRSRCSLLEPGASLYISGYRSRCSLLEPVILFALPLRCFSAF